MNYYYRLFGLTAACNEPIPGLSAVEGNGFDLRIEFGSRPSQSLHRYSSCESLFFTSSVKTESGVPAFQIFSNAEGSVIRLAYADGMEFWLDCEESIVWARWPDSFTLADAAVCLLGPVFGLLLRRNGVVCLHASAVVIGHRAVLFMGASGAGKSTMAGAMARRGHALLSDDIVPIVQRSGCCCVTSAYAYVSLWPESASVLAGDRKLPVLSGNVDKHRFEPATFHELDAALGAIFVLAERSSDDDCPKIEELEYPRRLLSLVENSYATSILDRNERAAEFNLFGRIVQDVPIKNLKAHANPRFLDKLCDLVEASLLNS